MSLPTNNLGNRHFHAWFIPGETYNHLGTRYYLGYMMEVGNRLVMTQTALSFVGQSMPETGTDWTEHVGGKGHRITKRLPLVLESWMIDSGSGYVVPTGETDDVGGVQCRRIWFETTSDLVAMGTAIQGKYITFADGGMSTIAAANAVLEPGTIGMYKLWITGTNETQGGGKIGVARRLPAEEIWWEQRLKTMVDVSCVGVLELAYGVRDPDLDTVPESVRYCLERYKCRISGATSKAAYGNMPFFAYDMAVELSDYDETTSEDTTVSTVDNVLASDRTYSDKMQVSWDDVDLADRYQVYVRTTETAPSGAELIAEQVTFTTPNVLVEVAAGELYCIEIQGGNYTYGTPKYYRGDGLVVSNVIQNTDPYLGNLPAAGAADTTRAYCRNRVMDGDETAAETAFKALVVSGRRFYIWVRARVERNGETDEWTALSTMATGLIRNI